MKRFTETTKWCDPWFRKLDPKFKALWLYLVDSCDVAGVWDADLELASFHIGAPFEHDEITRTFGERIRILPNGRWFLIKFIGYQYGELNPDNPCHKAVLRSLNSNQIEAPSKAHKRAFKGPQDKETDKEKDKEEGEHEGKQFPPELDNPDFSAAWKRWRKHRRELRKKLTPEMEETSLRKLARYGVARAIEIVDYTISKGWQGLADEEKVPFTAAPSSATPTIPAWLKTAEELKVALVENEGVQIDQVRPFVLARRTTVSEGGPAAWTWLKENLTPWGINAVREIWKEEKSAIRFLGLMD